MLLTIDVRRSRTAVGLFSGSGAYAKLVKTWRISSNPLLTADEFALRLRELAGTDVELLTGVSALSTESGGTLLLRIMLDRYWPSLPRMIVEHGGRQHIPLLVDNPREIGPERIVSCLAAYQRFGGPTIVVDFGAEIQVDLVSTKGEYLGGIIAPGLRTSVDQFVQRGPLRHIDLTRPATVVGTNTVDSIRSGAVFGFTALVDGLIDRIRDEVPPFNRCHVVATGSSAAFITPESRTIDHQEPHLALAGLRLAFEGRDRTTGGCLVVDAQKPRRCK